jgi:hypothetical protein
VALAGLRRTRYFLGYDDGDGGRADESQQSDYLQRHGGTIPSRRKLQKTSQPSGFQLRLDGDDDSTALQMENEAAIWICDAESQLDVCVNRYLLYV